jgi:hypothetical protein
VQRLFQQLKTLVNGFKAFKVFAIPGQGLIEDHRGGLR